ASSPPRVLAQPLRREVEATTDSIDAAVGYRWGEDSSLPVLGSDLRLEATTHWFDLREADSERVRAADFGGTLVTSPYLHPTVTNNVQGLNSSVLASTTAELRYSDVEVTLAGSHETAWSWLQWRPYCGVYYGSFEQDYSARFNNLAIVGDYYNLREQLATNYYGGSLGGYADLLLFENWTLLAGGGITPLWGDHTAANQQTARGTIADRYDASFAAGEATYRLQGRVSLTRSFRHLQLSLFAGVQYWEAAPTLSYPTATIGQPLSETRRVPTLGFEPWCDWQTGAQIAWLF
ncbi:MAG TPA: hypothetical protein VL096_00495, partial [Pirellulaceae bacterium]|nr:hypothetical protein [Pirellulaceae bacterium]